MPPRPSPIPTHSLLEAVRSVEPFRNLAAGLPRPGQAVALYGAVGSLVSLVLAALRRNHPDRVFVAVAASPSVASNIEADLAAASFHGELADGGDKSRCYVYPQREALPYERGEAHLDVGGLRVEAVEAVLTGSCRTLVTTPACPPRTRRRPPRPRLLKAHGTGR